METTRGLSRRLAAIEEAAGASPMLPCARCRRPHIEQAFSLEQLQVRHQGIREPITAVCGCTCCAATMAALVERYEATNGRAA